MAILLNLGIITRGAIDGFTDTKSQQSISDIYLTTTLTSQSRATLPDTLLTSDGNKIPVYVQRAQIGIPYDSVNNTQMIQISITAILTIIAFIWLVIEFIRLIIAFNHGSIFESKNFKRLTRIGICMISLAVLQFITQYACTQVISQSIGDFQNYNYDILNLLPSSDLIVGLIALLLSRIWQQGIALQNENELTV